MKNYGRILKAICSTPWAITPDKMEEIRGVIEARAAGITLTAAELRQFDKRKKKYTGINGNVAVLPLYGTISQRFGLITGSGGTSTDEFGRALDDALADQTVGAILADIDSPGGSVAGVQELADKIFASRGIKPMIAIANVQAASAAFWIAASFDELVVTPSGEAGSLGVFSVHEDYSAQNEADGKKVTYISAGEFKTEWNPDGPLTKEAFDFEQARINDYYEAFVNGVAKGRGVTPAVARKDFGRGRCLGARAAVRAGMADRVAPFDQVLSELNSARAQSGGTPAGPRRFHEARRRREIATKRAALGLPPKKTAAQMLKELRERESSPRTVPAVPRPSSASVALLRKKLALRK